MEDENQAVLSLPVSIPEQSQMVFFYPYRTPREYCLLNIHLSLKISHNYRVHQVQEHQATLLFFLFRINY